MKNISKLLLLSIALFCTSFSVEKKTYWVVSLQYTTSTTKYFGAKIIEANTKAEAISVLNKYIRNHKEFNGGHFEPCIDCDDKSKSLTIDKITQDIILK
jgi:hypothetical protein